MATLSELKIYVKQKKQVSLLELQQKFDATTEEIQGKMLHFIKKNQAKESTLTPHCQTTCNQCKPATNTFYTWTETIHHQS